MSTPQLILVVLLLIAVSLRFFPGLYYFFGIRLFHLGIHIGSLFSKKLSLMVKGRKHVFEQIAGQFNFPDSKKIWIHCASLGEFEQGRTLIEQIKSEFPDCRILLSFYSSSGYEKRKNYAFADHVTYLPFDSPAHARKFISTVKPHLAIFIKYEFWLYYLSELKRQGISHLLISSIFRNNQIFFRWYGTNFRRALRNYSQVFVQDLRSEELLKKYKIKNVSVGFDTRFDRVIQYAAGSKDFHLLAEWSSGFNVIVAGSTWPKDERLLSDAFYGTLWKLNFKFIIVPHEVHPRWIRKTKSKFKKYSVLYSKVEQLERTVFLNKRILIIDNVGMLASIYKYADVCYIGGGFNSGIHNTLEAAVYGKPVFFGPRYKKFREAEDLVAIGSAFSVRNETDLIHKLDYLNQFNIVLETAKSDAANYVASHSGGTETVMKSVRNYLS